MANRSASRTPSGRLRTNSGVHGRVYEYFLGKFASQEGKGGGEFYTPRSVVNLLMQQAELLANRSWLGNGP
jgi:type I restriction-modification system DNA methylase subunit